MYEANGATKTAELFKGSLERTREQLKEMISDLMDVADASDQATAARLCAVYARMHRSVGEITADIRGSIFGD